MRTSSFGFIAVVETRLDRRPSVNRDRVHVRCEKVERRAYDRATRKSFAETGTRFAGTPKCARARARSISRRTSRGKLAGKAEESRFPRELVLRMLNTFPSREFASPSRFFNIRSVRSRARVAAFADLAFWILRGIWRSESPRLQDFSISSSMLFSVLVTEGDGETSSSRSSDRTGRTRNPSSSAEEDPSGRKEEP